MIFSHDFYIGFKLINKNYDLSNNGILTLFTDVAGMHSEYCGDNFFTSETRWIVLAYKVHIIKRPKFASTVTISTWSTNVDNLTAEREFEIKDTNGNILIYAKSKWVSINYATKRIERINQNKMLAYESQPEITNFDNSQIGKLNEPLSVVASTDIAIDYKWIDINNHLNNTYYLDIAEQSLPNDLHEKISTMNFEIMYKKEVVENQIVTSLFAEINNEIYVILKSKENSTLHSIIKFYQ